MIQASDNRINSLQDWRDFQNEAAATQAIWLQYFESLAEHPENKRKDQAEELQTMYTSCFKKALTAPEPMRDLIIRQKGWAFSRMAMEGEIGNADSYKWYFLNPTFEEEFRLYNSFNHGAGYEKGMDVDVSQYCEFAAGYCCNQLLNFADNKGREIISKHNPSFAKLAELTKKLEERKLFDEIYVARISIIQTFYVYTGLLFSDDEGKRDAWCERAWELLNELNDAPIGT